MSKIKIKSYYGEWETVQPIEAQRFVKELYNGMTALDPEQKIKAINKNHLRGTTYEELVGTSKTERNVQLCLH